jgi:hypothetical protein
MNLAKVRNTNEIIEAEELRFILKSEMPEFQCPDENCGAILVAASYLDHNKQRPHFKTSKGSEHSQKCKFSTYAKLLEVGGKRKITFEEFENMPVPTKLIKPKQKTENELFKSASGIDLDENLTSTRKGKSGDFEKGGNSFKSVTTISQITDFYLSCPFNRDIKLNILGTEKEYMYWFKRIQKPNSVAKYQGTQIFFGQLHTNMGYIRKSENEILIKLFECEEWVDNTSSSLTQNKKTQKNPFFARINTENLTERKKTKILNELKYATQEQKEAHKNGKSSKKKAYLFFIGEAPNIENPYTFNVLEGYLCARFAEIKKTNIH